MNEPILHAYSTIVAAIHSWRSIRNVRRILIYKLDHLGDVLLATPALEGIRRRFPNAEIRIVIGEWSRSVLENNPNVDGVIIYNSKEFARHPYTAHRFSDLKRKLGSWKPDLIIGLRDDWRTITGGFFSGARRINRGRVHMKEWIERKRSDRSHSSHEVIRLWDVLAPLGVEPVEVDHLHYTVTDQERERAAEFMMAHGIEPPFAVIHAGTSVPVKEWSLERFAASARHIAGGYGMRIVLIGAPEEVDRSADLALMIPELDPIDITGKLSLRATAAVLERASLYLGSDGGAMHIASSVGAPTLGLFGPGSYHIFSPVGEHAAAISHFFPCSPCPMTTCIRPHDTCMQSITIEEVLRETDKLVGGSKAHAASNVEYSHQCPP